MLGSLVGAQESLGVLGELVHVDHVGDAAQFVQANKGVLAHQPGLDATHEHDRQPDEDDVLESRLQHHDPVIETTNLAGGEVHRQRGEHGDCEAEEDQRSDAVAERPAGAVQLGEAIACGACRRLQVMADLADSPPIEALVDAQREVLSGRDDGGSLKAGRVHLFSVGTR